MANGSVVIRSSVTWGGALAIAIGAAAAWPDPRGGVPAQDADPAAPVYEVRPIGWVRKRDGRTTIEIEPRYRPALLGLEQFESMMREDNSRPIGRTLDFLAQEMLREANTIASKSGDVEISRDIVEIKGAIDRIKEMVQNIEGWNRRFERHADLIMPGRVAEDVRIAQETGRTAIFFGLQTPSPIEADIGLVEILHTLGIRFTRSALFVAHPLLNSIDFLLPVAEFLHGLLVFRHKFQRTGELIMGTGIQPNFQAPACQTHVGIRDALIGLLSTFIELLDCLC